MPELKPGSRLKSTVCSTEVMVVMAPEGELTLSCGGAPMIPMEEDSPGGRALDENAKGGTLLGKRYVDEGGTLEVLCTKPGEGSLALDGQPLNRKEAKPLPASD